MRFTSILIAIATPERYHVHAADIMIKLKSRRLDEKEKHGHVLSLE